MKNFFGIAYFLIGIFQFLAIWDGSMLALGVGNMLGFLIAAFITYIPVVGSVMGVYGAHNVWDWELWKAVALFFWYIPIAIVFFIYSIAADH